MSDVDQLERPAKRRGKTTFELDPIKAAEAARAVVESMRAIVGEDGDLIADMVEGETDFYEVLDALVAANGADGALVDGIDRHVDDMKARKERIEKRIATRRALIEQALSIAEVPKVERPCGTLSLSQRAPKLVIDEEADIPAGFWKPGAPTLDRTALTAAVKEHEAQVALRLDLWRSLHGADAPPPNDLPPPIPGAHLEPAPLTLTIRVK